MAAIPFPNWFFPIEKEYEKYKKLTQIRSVRFPKPTEGKLLPKISHSFKEIKPVLKKSEDHDHLTAFKDIMLRTSLRSMTELFIKSFEMVKAVDVEGIVMAVTEGSRRVKGVRIGGENVGRYVRYTEKQIEALDRVYAECPIPNRFQQAEIICEEPALRGLDNKQLKIWFQNRRSREKQKKESDDIMLENRRLTAANNLLRQENDDLRQHVTQLTNENEHLRNQILDLTSHITTFDLDHLLEEHHPEMCSTAADNNSSLFSLAAEIRKEFLSKAIRTAINCTLAPGLKVLTVAFYRDHLGKPSNQFNFNFFCLLERNSLQTFEMLKDHPSWSRFCHGMDVVAEYPTNGGAIELIYTKYYAPTTLALARDFWTLRYSSILDDGSLVVCEKSISASDAGPSSPTALEFVRMRMLASGYMIGPGEEGSTRHIVEHYDFEASSIPVVVRPLYESSELLGKKTIVPALLYIDHMANETSGIPRHSCYEDPALLRCFCLRLSRGFNDAVNCFSEDGCTLMNANSSDGIIMSAKRTTNFGVYANCDSILCLKASLQLQNVFPASLVKLLAECRAAWMGFNVSALFGQTNNKDKMINGMADLVQN
ncbi:homeobox leucine-zipper protein [Striga asiatica]|uniref:Homeobox leucine-zipper protein n=1 Tax=Striga asiatica TaxID=4170 RepID=A0A5A7PBJ7_STRAF|nr:homeobox leucine-zipper protein [Striga asiatica]